MIAWAFPGQGSQKPRMGADLGAFAQLCRRAEQITGLRLLERCSTVDAPEWGADDLQQAIFVTSVAATIAASRSLAPPSAVIGHSLGDYASLVQANVLGFDAALELVDVRGRAMAMAGAGCPGAMAAIYGFEPARVTEICEEIPDVWPASFNSPTQTVVSGAIAGVERACQACASEGSPRITRLPIAIACHTPLMAPAAERVGTMLAGMELGQPTTRFYSTLDASPKRDARAIADALVAGITRPVLFAATVQRLRSDGVTGLVEVGPGCVLRGLARSHFDRAAVLSIGSDADARRVAARLDSRSDGRRRC